MKNFGKALKLYLKVSFNPLLALLSAVIIVGVMIAAVLEPEIPESDEYMSMIAAAATGQIGIVVFCLGGTISIIRGKFYSSLPFAKTLFTVVPTVFTAGLSLIYDLIIITIAALCWVPQALADIMIAAPVGSLMVILGVSCSGKSKLEWLYILPFFILCTMQFILSKISVTMHGFGLPVITSAIIGALIFAAEIAVTLVIMNIWWKKCDHTYRMKCGPLSVRENG